MSSALERTVWVIDWTCLWQYAAVISGISTHGPPLPISCLHCSHVPGPPSFWHSSITQRSPIQASSCKPRNNHWTASNAVASAVCSPNSMVKDRGYRTNVSLQLQHHALISLEGVAWAWAEANPENRPRSRSSGQGGYRVFEIPCQQIAALARLRRSIFWKLWRRRSGVPVGSHHPTSAESGGDAQAPNATSSSATLAVSLRLHRG